MYAHISASISVLRGNLINGIYHQDVGTLTQFLINCAHFIVDDVLELVATFQSVRICPATRMSRRYASGHAKSDTIPSNLRSNKYQPSCRPQSSSEQSLPFRSRARNTLQSCTLVHTHPTTKEYDHHLLTTVITTPLLPLPSKRQSRNRVHNPPDARLPSSDLAGRARVRRRHIHARITRKEVPRSKKDRHGLRWHYGIIFRRWKMREAKSVPEHDVCIIE